MEEIFKNLQKESKNNVDGLVKWMKDAKLVESSKAGEEKARALFADVSNKGSVELDKFKEAVSKLAQEQHRSFEDLSKQLAAEGPKMLQNALSSGVSALKDALNLGK